MPKGSPELTASRKEEIMNACETLYQTMSFKEITIKEIGAFTSFTRTSIYNYFQTKEEIFLALMQREYEQWASEIQALADTHDTMSAAKFAESLAHSLEKHVLLLKLLAMNHYDMEEHSRPERLTDFKVAYGASLDAVRSCLCKFFPDIDAFKYVQKVYSLVAERVKTDLVARPGLYELLPYLKKEGYKLAVSSGSDRSIVMSNLETSGLTDYFSVVVCGDEHELGKPDPEGYLITASRLGCDPKDCYVLEDSFNGVRSGYRAGSSVLMVPGDVQPDDEIRSLCTGVYPSLTQVKENMEAGIL